VVISHTTETSSRCGGVRTPNDWLSQGHGVGRVLLAFSDDGRRLLTTSRDGTLRVWNAHTAELVRPPMRVLPENAGASWFAARFDVAEWRAGGRGCLKW
jgi:WD40 repeat protein